MELAQPALQIAGSFYHTKMRLRLKRSRTAVFQSGLKPGTYKDVVEHPRMYRAVPPLTRRNGFAPCIFR
jgi:hypothetical protein